MNIWKQREQRLASSKLILGRKEVLLFNKLWFGDPSKLCIHLTLWHYYHWCRVIQVMKPTSIPMWIMSPHMREGGCQPFIERGGMLAIHQEGEVAVWWERKEAAVCYGRSEEQWISTLLRNSKVNDVGLLNSMDLNKLQLTTWSCSYSIQGEHIRKRWTVWRILGIDMCIRYDNVDTNLQLNLPQIWCQGKAGINITDVWCMCDWPLTLYNFSWLHFLLRFTTYVRLFKASGSLRSSIFQAPETTQI